MGVYSRNREEWAVVALACMRSSVTIVPFFDSLGKDGLTFVINHPQLECMTTEAKNLAKLMDLKREGLIPSLKHIVIIEGVKEEQRVDA